MAETPSQQEVKYVPIVNPYGDVVQIDENQAQDAISNAGFRQPTPNEVNTAQNQAQYGSGIGNIVHAGALGFARHATMGLFDALASHAIGPDYVKEAKGLEQQHPLATGVGGALGIAGMLAAPELGAVGAGGEAGEVAKAGFQAGDLLNPVKAASKLGSGVTEAAMPMAKRVASIFADAETAPIANKILSRAGASALGSAVEAQAYALGNAVSESSLGDPDAFGQKLVANMGHAAIWGGGIGALLGGAMAPFMKDEALSDVGAASARAGREVPEIAQANLQKADSFEESVKGSGLSQPEKEGIFDGFKKLKGNVKEIDEASERLGVEAFPSQRSDSEFLQNRYGMATQSPTPFGVSEAQKIQNSVKTIGNKINEVLGPESTMSEAEFGNHLKEGLVKTIKTELDPINDLYENQIKPIFQGVPISSRSVGPIAKNILKLEDLVNEDGTAIRPSSPQYQFASGVAKDLKNIQSVDGLKKFRTSLRQEVTGNPALTHVHSIIQGKLGDLEENAILRFAENEMKTPTAKAAVENVLNLRKEANARYSALKDNLSQLGVMTGKRRIYGPQGMIDHIEDGIRPELLGKKMVDMMKNTSTGNAEGLAFMRDHFPDQFNQIKTFVKGKIRGDSFENGAINTTKALDAVNKMSPEAKKMFFDPKEAQILQDANTWKKSWPQKWGPSGTPQGVQYLDFFKNPIAGAMMTGRDLAGLKFAKMFAGNTNDAVRASVLGTLERAAAKTTQSVMNLSKKIFTPENIGGAAGANIPERDSREKQEKRIQTILHVASDPHLMMNGLSAATHPLFMIAPNVASGVNQTTAIATHFLASKIPQFPSPSPLSSQFKMSNGDLAKFNRYYDAVEKPVSVLHQVRSGNLSPEAVEAVQAVYPKLYQEMKTQVMGHMMDHLGKSKELPYAKKMTLSLFLGQDLVDSLQQPNLAANQAEMLRASASNPITTMNNGMKSTQAGLSKLTKSSRMMTATQDVATRERG